MPGSKPYPSDPLRMPPNPAAIDLQDRRDRNQPKRVSPLTITANPRASMAILDHRSRFALSCMRVSNSRAIFALEHNDSQDDSASLFQAWARRAHPRVPQTAASRLIAVGKFGLMDVCFWRASSAATTLLKAVRSSPARCAIGQPFYVLGGQFSVPSFLYHGESVV